MAPFSSRPFATARAEPGSGAEQSGAGPAPAPLTGTTQTAPFGAYGKLPVLGDFLRHALPQGFVEGWDAWLQRALTDARAQLGLRWDQAYMSAPIWRFALAPGQAGSQAMLGVVMPSVDRVGRRFPLTLAAPVPPAPPLELLAAQETALARLELLALAALEDSMTRARLEAGLAAVQLAAMPPSAQPVALAGGGVAVSAASPPRLLATLAGAAAAGTRAAFLAALDGQARLLCLPALPTGAAATALFDLAAPAWAGSGWAGQRT